MDKITIKAYSKNINTTIVLNGSKSIANRVLIIQALCKENFKIFNLPNAEDTVQLLSALQNPDEKINAGAGGTTYRFLTALLSTQEGRSVELYGTERMHQRPIKILVDSLNTLGAEIIYKEKLGFPPLKIIGKKIQGGQLTIAANTSSQFITSLLLIAPTFKNGLQLTLEGDIVSLPYIMMTIAIMQYFGIAVEMKENIIYVPHGNYIAKDFFVEADWSAASYYYSIAALSKEATIRLEGLQQNSLQGDARVVEIYEKLGVFTQYENNSIVISKNKNFPLPEELFYDFLPCPDLAQTVLATCAGMNIVAKFKGLQTLSIKETDRVNAMDTELSKLGFKFNKIEENLWQLTKINNEPNTTISFDTYEDHRMAMALAPLTLKLNYVTIVEPNVVSKSYPNFWIDLEKCDIR
jgi:3-phosphoshikimate 1-carboxyvinyltransferase